MASVSVDTRTILMVILVVGVLLGGSYLLNPSYTRRLLGLREGFESNMPSTLSEAANYKMNGAAMDASGKQQEDEERANKHIAEGFKGDEEKEEDGGEEGFEGEPEEDFEDGGNGEEEPFEDGGDGEEKEEFKNASSVSGFADLSDMEGPSKFGNAEAPAGCYPRDQLTPSELLPKDPNSVWAQQNPMGTGSLKGKNFLSAGALIGVNTVGQSLRNANYQLRSEPPNPQVAVSVFNQTTIEPDVNRRTLEIA